MLTWHHQEPLFRIGAARNLTICVWFDAPTMDRMRRLDDLSKAQRRAYPAGTGLMNLIVTGTPNFSKDVRDEAARLTAETTNDLAAAHVILLGGLKGVAVRTFLSTVFLVGRPTVPTKVFDSVGTAAGWLAPLLSRGQSPWSPAEIEALGPPAIAT